MMPILKMLNKIKWSPNETWAEHELTYYNRITKKEIKTNFENITDVIDGLILIYDEECFQKQIPSHRIRKIYKKGELIWQRKKQV
jgi:uncharacterized protein (UPF0248 family)